MSAFNVVRAAAGCPLCHRTAEFEVQFKYGDTWQHSYRLGDALRWGGNDIGKPGHKEVRVHGVGGPCPHCLADNLDFDVIIRDDRIVGVEPVTEKRLASSEGFIVVEP